VLQGQPAPADPSTKARLAALAQLPAQQHFATAASLYAGALAQQPNLAGAHRYNAACSAALAGCGQGKDAATLNAAERLRWPGRGRPLPGCGPHPGGRARRRRAAPPAEAPGARRSLEHWRRDSDLAGVRQKQALARLPAEEQDAWGKLWAEVDTLLAAKAAPR